MNFGYRIKESCHQISFTFTGVFVVKIFTFTTGSGVRLAAILLRVLGEGVANALLGPFGALGVLNKKKMMMSTCLN